MTVSRDEAITHLYQHLHTYQKQIVEFVIQTPACGLFLPCGAGKTLITLTALTRLQPNGHILIVGPKPVVRATWVDEIEKWGLPLRTKSLVVNENGTTLRRAKREERMAELEHEPPAVCFINAENIPKLVEFFKKKTWPFPIVVLDEAQMFKNNSSRRFKALRSVRKQIARIIELSGTPTPNSLEDLWALIALLDGGVRLGKSMTAYHYAYFTPGHVVVNGFPATWDLRPGFDRYIYQAIQDIVVSLPTNNVALPDLTIDDTLVAMDKDEMALYREMKRECVLELQDPANPDATPQEIIAVNAAVLSGKLRQMASGTLYIDEDKNFAILHNHKLEKTLEIIQQAGSPVLIAYQFKCDEKRIREFLNANKVAAETFDGSPAMVNRWNAGAIPAMLIQPASAGHGLNLQTGPGHTLIWYTLPWSLEEYIQTSARIHRQGQKNPVIIHRLLCKHTVDTQVANALVSKDVTQKALLQAVMAEFDMNN